MTQPIWTLEALHEHIQLQLTHLKILLDERYETQTKAVDAAFVAQQTAMQTALTTAEKAVAAALNAAQIAGTKRDADMDVRLAALNELRKVVEDVNKLQMPRAEAEVVRQSLLEKIELLTTQVASMTVAQATRREGLGDKRAVSGLQLAALAALVGVIGLVVTVVVLFK